MENIGKFEMILYDSLVISLMMITITYAKQNPCQSTEHCSCVIKNWDYVYNCQLNSNDQPVTVLVRHLTTKINCHDNPSFNSSYLPEVNYASNVLTLELVRCPIPQDGFGMVLKTFKSKHTRTLFYQLRTNINKTLTEDDFKELVDLEDLVLHNNHLTTWNSSTTKHLRKLKVLSLDFNNLQLYDDMFRYATTATYLSIQNNSLTHLPKRVFKGLINVDRLHLENNQIRNLDREILEDLVNLQYLMMYNNQLHHLDENIFDRFPLLVWIYVNGNDLRNVSRKTFSYCKPEVIKVNNNINLHVTNDLFSNFFTLIWAESMNIGLETISENFYSNSVNLEYINLRRNRLKTLPENVFKGMEYLKTLDLGQNKITEVKSELFAPLKNLIILYLDENSLTTIFDNVFPKSSKLTNIELGGNRISNFQSNTKMTNGDEMSEWLKENRSSSNIYTSLKSLNLAHNILENYPENSIIIASAQNVHLDYNSIESINITSFHYLMNRNQTVNLQYNNISTIYFENIVRNNSKRRNLEIKLQISHNPIKCDCDSYDLVNYINDKNNTNIDGIKLEYGNLSCSSPEELTDIPLEDVPPKNLTCHFKPGCTKNDVCACFYRPLGNTVIIDCSSRYLSNVPVLQMESILEKYTEIDDIEVHLDDNFLTQISEDVDGYSKVTRLYLQNNFIANISWIPSFIKFLDLENNNLTTLSLDILKQLTSTRNKEINLSNNPWKCSCQNLELSHALKNRTLAVTNINNIRCNSSGTSLVTLNDEDICPIDINLVFILTPVCLILSLVAIILILICYIYSEFILAWLYSRGFCLCLIKEERTDKSKKYDAFISFASQDEKFVFEQLVPELEKGTPSFKLCVHSRDWLPGLFINTQITDSIKYSRRTLVVLSKYFLKSVWGRLEFRTAHTQAIKEGRVRVILIVYGEVDMESFDDEMKTYIETNTYIQWGDPWFWEKLKYALPRRHHKQNQTEKEKTEISRNDNLHNSVAMSTIDTGR